MQVSRYSESISENILFSKLKNNDIIELCFNSNFSCKCLANKKFIRKRSEIKLLKLEQLADPTQFGYYTTHEFHILTEKLNLNRKNDFSIFHSSICSLQSNIDNMQILIDNLDFQFDVLAVTETWYTKDNFHFTPGIIEGYHRYEGNTGSSVKEGCGFFIKDTLVYNN